MEQIAYQSQLIDIEEARKTGCFTTLPIRIHPRKDVADAATHKFIRDWDLYIGDGREKKTHFSFSPVGNWTALIYPEAFTERLGILTYLSDLGLIHDDVGEDLDVEEATAEHDILKAALDPNDKRKLSEGSKAMNTKKLVSQCMLECIALDHELGMKMLAAFRDLWLAIGENHSDKEIMTMEEYTVHRGNNGGMLVFWPMLQFSTGINISEEESELVKPIFDAATQGLLLANDYWSWEREYRSFKAGETKRLVSAVEVIARTRSLSIEDSQEAVKEMIITAEGEFVRRRDDLYRLHPNISMKLRKWIEICGLAVSGNHYWCSAAPRHNAWRKEELSGIQPIQRTSKALHERPDPSLDRQVYKKPKTSTGSSTDIPSPPESVIHVSNGTNGLKAVKAMENGRKPHNITKASDHSWHKPDSIALESPCAYIASLPSKGVRATLIEALNYWLDVPAKPLKVIETVVNVLHNASLILDDIEDNSPLRRGKAATHTIFGHAQSINAANFMYVKATAQVQKGLNPQALDVLLEELEGLYLGQSWDLYWKHNLMCPTEEEYINMVDHKTGGMFRMLLRLMETESPLVLSTFNFDRMTLLFGRFFQIRDDYMNFGDYANQKGFCEDLDEGKFSYPIVYCLEHHPEFRGHILGILRQRPAGVSPDAAPLAKEGKMHIITCLETSGAFEASWRCMEELETELDMEIGRLESATGVTNPMLRLLLARLSVKGIQKFGMANGVI
ncbi:geranylgeranyl pyrophosphate synthase [Wilcoxina mikolae CBS 423.85]|nr:geranylgeranyl pyrophosphate synthase [Wilcoxina mikolae CBS 423.85]